METEGKVDICQKIRSLNTYILQVVRKDPRAFLRSDIIGAELSYKKAIVELTLTRKKEQERWEKERETGQLNKRILIYAGKGGKENV